MRTRALLVVTLLLGLAGTAAAQRQKRISSAIPAWADSALTKAGVYARYDLTSDLNPDVREGDFNGDGLLDLAVAIVRPAARRRGLAIVHRLADSVHIVGAGQPLGNGKDGLPDIDHWSVQRLGSHRDALFVDGWGRTSGWILWDGQKYVWLADP